MIQIKLTTIGESVASDLIAKLNRGQLKRAMKSASRQAIKGVKVEIPKKVPERFTAKKSDVRNSSTITTRATAEESSVTVRGSRLPLIKFKHNPTSIMNFRGNLSVEVQRGEHVDRSPAFVQKIGGRLSIFQRLGRRLYPVRSLRGASVPEMVTSRRVHEPIAEKMLERYETELERWLDS